MKSDKETVEFREKLSVVKEKIGYILLSISQLGT